MAVAANLDVQTCRWRVRQVRGHDCRRTPAESKGVGGHAPITERDEIFLPSPTVFDQQVDRVRAVRRRFPLCLRLAQAVLAQGFAGLQPSRRELSRSL